jgi:hypothetical protein
MSQMNRRIMKIEAALSGNGVRYIVHAFPKADTPAEIDAAIKRAAMNMGVPIESVDAAMLWLKNDLREHKINPSADIAKLSDKGILKTVLDRLPPCTGLPCAPDLNKG